MTPPRTSFALLLTTFLLALPVLAVSCGDDEPPPGPAGEDCRFEPANCGGDLGALCVNDSDCWDAYCCTEQSNCGGGMCTLPCDRNDDCPSFMACEHHVCFFRCSDDADCAAGQSCEHDNTICEWP